MHGLPLPVGPLAPGRQPSTHEERPTMRSRRWPPSDEGGPQVPPADLRLPRADLLVSGASYGDRLRPNGGQFKRLGWLFDPRRGHTGGQAALARAIQTHDVRAFARLVRATSPPSRRKRRSDARIGGLQPRSQPARQHRRVRASVASVSNVASPWLRPSIADSPPQTLELPMVGA